MNIVEVTIVGACIVIAAIAAPIIHQKQQGPDKLQQALDDFQKELDRQDNKVFTVTEVIQCNSANNESYKCIVKLDNSQIRLAKWPVHVAKKIKFSELK